MWPFRRLQDVKPVKLRAYYASGRPSPPLPRGRAQPFRGPSKRANQPEEPSVAELPRVTDGKSRAFAWLFLSMLAGGIAFYSTKLYIEARRPVQNPAIADVANQKDVAGRYDITADTFDSELGLSELVLGINSMRKKMSKKCTGHVLEVSCGTGRNIGYFDIVEENSKIDSLTFVDLSPQMIEVCMKKFHVFRSTTRRKLKPDLQVRFKQGSALGKMPLAPNNKKYDTVIQTIGLCSTPLPVDLIVNMVNYLDTSNPDARILLLEHGRSDLTWLNNILDNSAERHAEIHGCWFNRNIGAFVEEAVQKTGMEIVEQRRHHFGTTWVYELKPGPALLKNVPGFEDTEGEQQELSTWRTWLGLK